MTTVLSKIVVLNLIVSTANDNNVKDYCNTIGKFQINKIYKKIDAIIKQCNRLDSSLNDKENKSQHVEKDKIMIEIIDKLSKANEERKKERKNRKRIEKKMKRQQN